MRKTPLVYELEFFDENKILIVMNSPGTVTKGNAHSKNEQFGKEPFKKGAAPDDIDMFVKVRPGALVPGCDCVEHTSIVDSDPGGGSVLEHVALGRIVIIIRLWHCESE